MNKSNKILLGVLSFVVVCVVGYALFSEDISISGSAMAKGEWSLVSTCTFGVTDEFLLATGSTREDAPEGGYSNEFCNINGNIVTFGADLAYPTAARYFTIKVTNNGTINASFNIGTGLNATSGQMCYDGQNTGGVTDGVLKDSDDCKSVASHELNIVDIAPLGFSKADGKIIDIYSPNLMGSSYDENTDEVTIEPNESIYFLAVVAWPDDRISSSNSFLAKQNRTYEFKFNQKVD